MTQAATPPVVQWHPWNADAFERARRDGRPILLSLTAAWSEGCREMDRRTYADAGVVADINERFVPIRVDADERPDIADRYELGGIPTIAFLSPSGELLGGGTFVDAQRLRDVLSRVPSSLERTGSVSAGDAPGAAAARSCAPPDDAVIEEAVFATADGQHGGFGGAPKFPHDAPVRLAFARHAERDDAGMLACATRALDAMGWSELFDPESGGFFRCCAGADWSSPQRDLLLGVNAALLHTYLEAVERTALERYYARAGDLARFIDTRLRRQDGAWRISAGVPSSRVFTDVNAHAASALLRAARVFEDTALASRALAGLEQVVLASYKPGEGVAHYAGGGRGLLTDHVAMTTALLDAWDESGNIVYRMMAEELCAFAIRTMWDAHEGGFLDRAPLLYGREPSGAPLTLKPFVLNCQAAVALRRLAEATNDGALAARASDVLASISSAAAAHGPDAAHYLLARRAILR